MIGGVEAIVFTSIQRQFRLLLVSALFGLASIAQARVELSPCHNNYSPEAQIQLGEQSKTQVYKQMPVLPDSNPVSQYVEHLGAKLAHDAPGYKWPYNFHVVNTDEINAFALPGGTIFVNLGTVQAAQDEAQLAGVMAHEISHVVLQHSVCNAEKEQRVGLLAGLSQVAIGVALGDGTAGQMADRGIQETTSLGFLKMSRGDEKQADLEGAGILYDAGYDPHGMSQFFAIIEAKYGEGDAQFLSDHPNPGNRTEYVDREIASFPARETNVTTSPDFARIQKIAGGMHAYTEGEIASGAWKQNPQGSSASSKNTPERRSAKAGAPDLSTPTRWKDIPVNGLTVEIPANWRVFRGNGQALAGPQGGVLRGTDGNAGSITYGMMADVYRPAKGATTGDALAALLKEITNDNPNIKTGEQRQTKVGGVELQTVECTNRHGRGGRNEHYWIAALPETNGGGMRYLAFVAPTADFRQMRPTFHHILRSLTVQF